MTICIYNYAKYYNMMGLKVIPLHPNSKRPIEKGWNVDWEEQKVLATFRQRNDLNIGLFLGDIVDVEGDSEAANNLLTEIIGDYPHPIYKSRNSIHHLFLNPDPRLTRITKNDIEFRGHKHQSVLPPSMHPDGGRYTWLTECFPIPKMPTSLFNYYLALKSEKTGVPIVIAKKIDKRSIRPWCFKCGKKIVIHRKRYKLELEAFKQLGSPWLCRKCRQVDIRRLCRKLKV